MTFTCKLGRLDGTLPTRPRSDDGARLEAQRSLETARAKWAWYGAQYGVPSGVVSLPRLGSGDDEVPEIRRGDRDHRRDRHADRRVNGVGLQRL